MPTIYDRFLARAVGRAVCGELLLSLGFWIMVVQPWHSVTALMEVPRFMLGVVMLTFITNIMTLPITVITAVVLARRVYRTRPTPTRSTTIGIGVDTALQGILFLLCFSIFSNPGRSQLWNLQMITFMLVLPGFMYTIHREWLHVRVVVAGVLMIHVVAAIAEFGTMPSGWQSYLLNVAAPVLAYVIGTSALAVSLHYELATHPIPAISHPST